MRLVIRFLVALGLVLSAGLVSPLAEATTGPTPTPTAPASSSASSSDSSSDASTGSTDSPSASATGDATASPSDGTKSQTATPSAAAQGKAAAAEATDPTLDATIDSAPTSISVDTSPTFRFHVDSVNPAVTFRCQLTRPGMAARSDDCTAGKTIDAVNGRTNGQFSYSGLAADTQQYTFKVTASVAVPAASGAPASYDWHLYSVMSPDHFTVSEGASFNNPLGNSAARRRNLARVIHAVKSMPGYAQPADSAAPCPTLASGQVPSTIKITLYSMVDGLLADAMNAASRRCVSVQILMNNHLNASNDGAWKKLSVGLGNARGHRSFAYRCGFGCRGRGVLHTKMYLFDSHVPAPRADANDINDVVMVGSSNMTSNASHIQWNDLYGIKNATMFNKYSEYFNLMKIDRGFHRNTGANAEFANLTVGPYRTTFWPIAAGATEPYITALNQIQCSGATGGSGINGHTVVYINMHAWFGVRGLSIERKVRDLYSRGCYIKILYSFMTPRVYHRLTDGTGGRMSARRTVFSTDGDRFADVYSHFKNIAASGNIAGDSNNQVVYTGSNNFTSDGDHFDEIMLRINLASAYRQYRDQFKHISERKSSARYATFLEARGGGRAPTPHARAMLAAPDAPVILSPDVTTDANGTPHALD